MNNRLYTIQEAANILGVSTKTLRRWDQGGRFVPTRTAGNQRRYTQDQINEFKKTPKSASKPASKAKFIEPLFQESAPKVQEAAHSLPSVLSGLPSNSFLRQHFILRHQEQANDESKNIVLRKEEESRQPLNRGYMSKFNPVKMGFMFAALLIMLSFAGAVVMTRYNVVSGLAQKKDQFVKFIANLPQISISIKPNDLSFAPQDGQAVLAAAVGKSNLALNVNVPSFFSQSVGIGTTTANPSAILDLTSEDKGFLAPRMTTAQRDAISAPASGLFVYNTVTKQYNMYDGTSWKAVGGMTAVGDVTVGDAFTQTGNSGNSLYFHGTGGGVGQITGAALSGNQTYTLPGATGTFITTGNLTDITKVGTIGSGTWNGTTIAVGNGGTGATSLTGILLGNGTSAITGLTTSTGIAGAISDETGTGSLVFNASPVFTGNVATENILPSASATYDLGSNTAYWNNIYANNFVSAQTGTSGYWQRNGNSITPSNITDSINLGSNATSSALIHLAGTSGENSWFNTGKVGIGTTNPVNSLDIGNNGGIHITSGVPTSTSMALYNNAGTLTWNGASLQAGTSISGTTNYISKFTSSSSLGDSALYESGGNLGIGDNFYWNNDDYRLGLGTTAPLATLDVAGSASVSGSISLNGEGTAHAFNIMDSGVLNFQRSVGGDTGLTSTMFLANSGYVGIGTTAPIAQLNVNVNTDTVAHSLALTNSSSFNGMWGQAIDFYNRGGGIGGGIRYVNTGGPMVGTMLELGNYYGDPNSFTSELTIISGGNVGVGNTYPLSLFSVGSSSQFQVNSAGAIAAATGITSSGTITFSGLSTGIAHLNSSGVMSSSAVNLATDVTGILGTANGGSFWNSSLGALYPGNTTRDILLGGTSTASAKFGFLNMAGGNPTATISSNLSLIVPTGNAYAATFNLLNNGTLNFQRSAGGDAGLASSLFLSNNGNIGIGTTAPAYKLQINVGGDDIYTTGTGNSGNGMFWNNTDGSSRTWYLAANGSTSAYGPAKGFFIRDWTGGATRLVIDTSGNVGIGTTNPLARLDVRGLNAGPAASVSASTSFASMVVDNSGIGDLFTASKSGATKFVISNSGNVGIGIGTPANKLDILNGDARLITDTDVMSRVLFTRNNLDVGEIGTRNSALTIKAWNNKDIFLTDYQDRGIVVKNGGNVGIGTTSPAGLLHLSGIAGGNATLIANTGNAVNDLFTASSSGTPKFTIANNGNINFAGSTSFMTTLTSAATAARTITFPDASGTICLSSGNCASDALWNTASGALYPGNTTMDLLVGGSSTSSAIIKLAGINTGTNNLLDIFNNGSSVFSVSSTQINNNLPTSFNAPGDVSMAYDLQFTNPTASYIKSYGPLYIQSGDSNANLPLVLSAAGTGNVTVNDTFLVQDTTDSTTAYQFMNASGSALLNIDTLNGQVGVLGQAGYSPFNVASSSGTSLFNIAANGYVGIGTTAPVSKLDSNVGTSTGPSTAYAVTAANASLSLSATNTTGTHLLMGIGQDYSYAWIQSQNIDSTRYGLALNPMGGNVGIGTTNPLTALDVAGSASLSANLSLRGAATAHTFNILDNGSLNFQRSAGGDAGLASALFLNSNGYVGIGTTAPGYKLEVAGDISINGGTKIDWAHGSAKIELLTYDLAFSNWTGSALTEKMRITSGGNVGIGTTNPLAALDVRGISGTTPAASISAQSSFASMIVDNSGIGGLFTASKSGATKFVINNAGNVGIGAAAPAAKLEVDTSDATAYSSTNLGVAASSYDALYAYNANSSANISSILLSAKGSGNAAVGRFGIVRTGTGAGDFFWGLRSNGSFTPELMRLTSAGNLGIGTTNPLATLDVRGASGTVPAASISAQTSFAAMIVDNSGIGDLFTASKSGATKFVVTNAGNVLIGTANPLAPLSVGLGSVSQPGINVINTSSASGNYYAGIQVLNNSNYAGLLYKANSNYTNWHTIYANDLGFYNSGSGNISILNDYAAGEIWLTAGAASSPHLVVKQTGYVGIGTTAPAGLLHVSGIAGGNATAIFDTRNSTNDLLTASSSGTPKFAINNNGNIQFAGSTSFLTTLTSAATAARTITFPDASGTLCLSSGNCASDMLWTSSLGALYPGNTTMDLLIGGTSTSSAIIKLAGINTGSNTLLDVLSSGTSLFNVSSTQINNNLPTSFNAPGDVSMAYDLQFTNPTASYIESAAPLYIQSGDSNSNYDLTLAGSGVGNVVINDTLIAQNITNSTTAYQFMNASGSALLNIDTLNGQVGVLGQAGYSPLNIASSSGTSLFNIAANGYVGIGTTNPLGNLSVYSAADVNATAGDFVVNASGTYPSVVVGRLSGTNNSSDSFIVRDRANNNVLVVNSGNVASGYSSYFSGNVGIGTTNPGARLAITTTDSTISQKITGPAGATSEYIQFVATTDGGDIRVGKQTGTNNNMILGTWTNNDISVYANSAEALRIKSGGNVGIGTTAPTGVLHVSGIAAGNATAIFDTRNSTNDLFTASSSGTPKFAINNNGNIQFAGSTSFMTTLTSAATAARTITFPDASGTLCLSSGNCSFDAFWNTGSGALYAGNTTMDLLLGGTSTASAKFGFLNMAGGNPTATISSNLSLIVPTGNAYAATFNLLNNGTLNFQRSAGGDAGLTSTLFLNNNGYIGIGTTAPGSLLTLANDGWISGISTSSGVTNMFKLNTADQIQVGAALNIDGGVTFPSDGGYVTAMDMPFTTTGTNAYVFRIGTSNVMSVYGQSDSSGNASNLSIGIGTTSPLATLDVRGLTGTIPAASISAQSSFASLLVDNSGTGDLFTASKSGATKFVITNAGNVGINGVTRPLVALDVTGSASLSANLSLRGASTAHTFNILDNGTLNFQRSAGGDAGLASALFLNSNGYVGIGTTAPAYPLTLNTPDIPAGFYYYRNNSPIGTLTASNNDFEINASTNNMRFNVPSGKMYSFMTGNFGIGTTNPLAALDVRGISGTTPAASISAQSSFASLIVDNSGIGGLFTASKSGATKFVIANNGNVGIGTANPLLRLDVQDSQSATVAAQIYNTNTGATAGGLAIKLGFTGTGTATNFFTTFLNGNGAIQGMVKSNAANGVTYQTNGIADFAEYFKKDQGQSIPFGSVVCLDDNGLATACDSNSNKIIGVASEQPAFLGGENLGDKSISVGLVGQVRTRVSAANGAIEIGDPLTTSSIDGVAVKATTVGQILGKALEAFDGEEEGTILVSVNISWYNPSVYVASDGTLTNVVSTVASLSDQLASQGDALQAQIASVSAQTNYILANDPLFKASQDKAADLQSKLDILSQKVEEQASASAFLTEIVENNVLGASTSAVLDLGDVEIHSATISSNLMVLGRTTVSDLGVTGNINAGVLAIHGIDGEISTLGGDLYLQKNGLGGVNIADGKVIIDSTGNMAVAGTISADTVESNSYTVLGDQSIGSAIIPAGLTSIEISTSVASSSSKIFLTSTSLTDKQITVVKKSAGKFKVAIPTSSATPISFDWWIVGNK